MLGGGCAATRLNHALVRSLMCLGARCIDSVSWFFTSVLDGVVSGRCDLAGLDEDLGGEGVLWATGALQSVLGSLSDALRNIAILPADFWTKAIAAARLSGEDKRQLTPIEAAQAGLLWRLAEKAAILQGGGSSQLFVDVDPFAPVRQLCRLAERRRCQAQARQLDASSNCPPWSTRETTPRSGVPRRSRWRPGTSSTSRSWGRHRRRRRSRLPTSCRCSIIAQWFWATRRTSITRCGARLGAKLPKRTSFARGFPQATARISPRNCQGPRMSSSGPRRGGFEVAAIMLDLSSMAALALYEKAVERLTRLRPSAWHLVVAADDKCRAEHIERIRRSCEVKRLAGPGLSVLPHCRH